MKNTKWFVQDTNLRETEILKDINTLSSLNMDWQTFGVFKEENEISGIYNDDFEQGILRCSIKVLRMLSGTQENDINKSLYEKLKKGISYNYNNFNQDFYIKKVNLPFLNGSSEIISIDSEKDLYLSYSKDMFIKPSDDQKCFVADTLPAGQTLRVFAENRNIHLDAIKKQKILINELIDIKGEYRFVCIKDEIAGYSKYLDRGKYDISGIVPEKVIQCAIEYAKVNHPSDIYTMDLCEIADGSIKIVEYNCWNCSGLYNINREALFSRINEYYQS